MLIVARPDQPSVSHLASILFHSFTRCPQTTTTPLTGPLHWLKPIRPLICSYRLYNTCSVNPSKSPPILWKHHHHHYHHPPLGQASVSRPLWTPSPRPPGYPESIRASVTERKSSPHPRNVRQNPQRKRRNQSRSILSPNREPETA